MLKCLLQLIANKTGKNVLPLELIIFVTQQCNLSCKHCFVKKNDVLRNELSLSELESISLAIPRLISLMLTGGEPFLRDDLPEIIKIFDKNSHPRVISVITNGVLTDKIKRALDNLYASSVNTSIILSISIDGDEAVHNRLRGGKNVYSELCNTMEMIKSHSIRNRILYGMNITLCKENENIDYETYKKLLEGAKIDFASVNLAREDIMGEYKDLDIHKYQQLSELINKYNKIKLQSASPIIKYMHSVKEEYQAQVIKDIYIERKNKGIICEAGRSIGVIDSSGNIYPCELLDKKFGSIREADFSSIWNNPANRLFSDDFIRRKKCFCHHECFISASINTNILNQLRSLIWYLFLNKKN
jgi:radical SAM protein with 4Fe4S-binding SPASM domain